MQFQPKHSVTGTNIFSVMSGLAVQHGAINLSQGFPDFPIDAGLADLLAEGTRSGVNQYAPMPGLPVLRQAIVADMQKRYGLSVDVDEEVTVTPGATYAIYTAFSAVLSPGDEAILLEPSYDSYIPNIEMNGAKAVPVALSAPDFHVDWNRVKSAITPKTRALILNTPHNPTGAVWSREDWDTLAEIVRDTQIVILSDEVYEQLIFDGLRHYSVLEHPELRQRSFALFSFGKVFNNTGWKVGYCIAPPEYTRAFRSIHQFLSFTVNSPAQYALAHHLSSGKASDVRATMEAKRNYFLSLMADTKFTIHQPTKGSYFQVASYERVSDLGDMDFAKWLTVEHGVATIPVSAFYHNRKDDKIIRFCFGKKEETLEKAVELLRKL